MMRFRSRKDLSQFFSPLYFSLHGVPGVEKRSWGQKNHRGFTLIEVMLSIMIMGLLMSPLSLMYTLILERVSKSSHAYNLIVLCKNLLHEAHQKQEVEAQTFSLEKKDINFDVTLSYSLDKGVDQKSMLASLQGVHREIVTVSWRQDGQNKQERLVGFVYKKPEQKKS